MKTVGKLAFLCHHEVPFEVLIAPKSVRVKYIKANKPKNEIPTRLKWFKIVPDEYISDVVRKALAAYSKAWTAYSNAWAECDKALAAHSTVLAVFNNAWAECDKAGAEFSTVRAEFNKAGAELRTVRTVYDNAVKKCPLLAKYLEEQIALGCPWNGKTLVFPEAK